MMKKMVFSWCIAAMSCLCVVPSSLSVCLADGKESAGAESLVKKAEKLRSLIEGGKAKGLNVSEALKLDQMSRDAAGKNDFANANKLIDEAIKALEAPAAQAAQNIESAEPVSSISLMKKAEKLHSLIGEAKAKGADASGALKLDQMSREAAGKSDFANANKLLDEAIKDLESPAAQKSETASSVSSSKQASQTTEDAEPVSSISLMKKAEKLHSLIGEAKAKSVDVSEALKLDQQSREAAGKSDFASANKLLDEAIKALESTSTQKTETASSESSAKKDSQEEKEEDEEEAEAEEGKDAKSASGESSAKQDSQKTESTVTTSGESSAKQDTQKTESKESPSSESSAKKTE